MPRFEPFRGIEYARPRFDLAAVTAPPYDVISPAEREVLAREPHNAVHVDLPVDEGQGDPYAAAAARLQAWLAAGDLVTTAEPVLYLYRMSFTDDGGMAGSTLGVIGALGLEPSGEGDVLPHEHTTPKARSDRLELLRATHANLSPIWGLSLAEGLSKQLDVDAAEAMGEWTDPDGVGHALWRVEDAELIQAVCDTVASAPVVIADGHHRYETCVAYRGERQAAAVAMAGADRTLTCVVELVDEQITVQAIHRLIDRLPTGFDALAALTAFFEPLEAGPPDRSLLSRMEEAGALALVLPGAAWLLHPRAEALAGAADYDSSRLDVALASFPPHGLTFQHGVGNVVDAVRTGQAQAGVLLRPVSVAQIAATADARDRMPPKTTFFWPKLRTGTVFRSLD
jgi:uncharacterized protein (DUF1015 family)